MDTLPTKINYDGTTTPAPSNAVHAADEFNDRNVELENAVTDSGQSLSSADPNQLSRAMFGNGVAAQSMTAGGTADVVKLFPVTGAGGYKVPTTYALMHGAIFNFLAAGTNTGNMQINVGQTSGTVLGALPLYLEDGVTNIPIGKVVVGRYYSVRYIDPSGIFVLIRADVFTPELYTGQESVTYPNGMIVKTGTDTTHTGNHPGGLLTASVVFGSAFPNSIKSVITTVRDDNGADVVVSTNSLAVTGFSIKLQEFAASAQIMQGVDWEAKGY